ncbi:hypothetical protein K437DRAFT_227221 [Tilletiaria anomala UBC 951]|uniref:Uncharacterized protein n=1 Tax=Tilletiaria anomala (strain ATCC 24038 / CBS 436.72 / UBC 951) TaxID=1037660 RepID=A0A066VGR9_TILAU|nr:uncharacterized protein K437DRAFT_227221 [Tilletiaria anomala UBC 951]KDN40686.1 hypothetical protein K437DRAFT_227221 [Tilletiaria anomala UBC 951]
MNARSDIASADMDPQDDPNLLASIPVYIARSIPHGTSLQVFQYPNYPAGRPLPIPTSAQERGLKESARWRSQANWVEVDLPIDMRAQVYNHETGKELGQNLENEGKTKKVKREDDETSERKSKKLEKIKLQSCEVPNTTRYLVGVMRDGALHLTNLNHVLQLRPSLHHLDANDIAEADARRRQREGGPDGAGSGDEGGAGSGRAAAKARAVTVSVKEDANSSTKSGAVGDKWEEMMLAQRKAEGEPWIPLTWLNEETPQAKKTFNAQLFAGSKTQLACTAAPADYLAKNLKSALRID